MTKKELIERIGDEVGRIESCRSEIKESEAEMSDALKWLGGLLYALRQETAAEPETAE